MKVKIPQELIDLGYISVQKHQEADYFIYNYTPKTVYESKWNEYTMMCRGLILNNRNVVVARPFVKFFNLQEYSGDSIPKELMNGEPCEVYEKVDGSLGILYHLPSGEPRIATRGSFTSEQALKATEILKKKYQAFNFDEQYTFLFEIIYPENRIVVDYGGIEDLILLGAIDKETGEEAPFHVLQEYSLLMAVPLVETYQLKTVDEVLEHMEKNPQTNSEGFVLKFKSGLRVKVKYEEYKRLHKLLTGINAKTIWEILKAEQPLDDILACVPDEFYSWVDKTAKGLQGQYEGCEKMCQRVIAEELHESWSVKEVAEYFLGKYPNESGILFAMLRGKPYKEIIWKQLKPKFAKAFKCDEQ